MTLNIYNQSTDNNIKIFTDYKLSENSLTVLNQKFYLGIYSEDCLIEFDNIPIIEQQNIDVKN